MTRLLTSFALLACAPLLAAPMPALIIDGQNNHEDWPKTTAMMKDYLEQTGLFKVDIARTAFTWKGEKHLPAYALPGVKTESRPKSEPDPNFKPDFFRYRLVLSNFGYNAAPWPAETKANFERYVREGGGLVVVHAANNSFGDWPEYNEIIGLGGWGGRNEKSGPYVYINQAGELIRDTSPGSGGAHGPQHLFKVQVRDPNHPVTRGMPPVWLHSKDELYDRLRGPAQRMLLLATAFSDPQYKGTNRHEPMLLTIEYGKGRVFHTPMGHADYSMECVGFIASLQRGAEWAATGAVTQALPPDFPSADKESVRRYPGRP
jgi:type 1 glutamine amidotransferase